MQDLPIDPAQTITAEQRAVLNSYLLNDLSTTEDLFKRLKPQIELRQKMSDRYGVDLRSKSDAQIAEAVIKSQIEERTKLAPIRPSYPVDYSFKYVAPAYIRFESEELRRVLDVFTRVDFTLSDKGDVAEPEEVGKLKVKIGSSVYQFGIGGIHSCEKSVAHFADKDHFIVDRDVTSYYPNIILSQRLAPEHLGENFLAVYRSILNERIAAKRSGDKVVNEALKIVVNGSFGKFGSKWSTLYAPRLLIQTTVTGQLALMMLVERLEARGISVVSANTDGIVIRCTRSKRDLMLSIFADWELSTGFQTEETEYSAVYSRDINNYVALKPDGKYKVKGAFADADLSKTPTSQVCVKAVVDFLQFGIPIDKTIQSCQDVRMFVNVRSVTGGAVKGDQYLGKAVRWFYAKDQSGAITYKKNGNKVPKTDGAKPLMELPDQLPSDIDYAYYVDEAQKMLKIVGWRE
jgi:hypothetical protein